MKISIKTVAVTAVLTCTVSQMALAQDCKNPETLRFSMIPTEEISQEIAIYKPLVEHLETTTGKQVEFFLPTSYASVVEAMIGGFVQVSMLGPNAYVIANEKRPSIQAFATYTTKESHFQKEGIGYKGLLLVRSDSDYQSIEDLAGSVVGLTDPASTSGNLLPRVSFTGVIGQELESYFSRVVYTGGHDLSAVAINEGHVDAAFVATLALDSTIDRGAVAKEDFRILWESDLVPQVPFTYDSDLCDAVKQDIETAFLTVHETEGGKVFLEDLNSTRFVEVEDSDYDIIRALRAAKAAK